MAGYLSIVTVKGHKYYRLVESYRENGKVKHRILVNYGSTPPEGISVSATKRKATDNVALTEKQHARIGKETIKTVSATKTVGKVESSKVSATVTPLDFQMVLQRRAVDNKMSVEDYLRKLLDILPDGTRRKHRKKD